MQEANNTPAGELAFAFAQAVVKGEFVQAYALLSNGLRQEMSPQDLESRYYAMIEYGGGPPDLIEVIQVDLMQEWPLRQEGDVGWAYVAICGEGYSEAVSVVVAEEAGCKVIRMVEWGRP